MDMDNCIVFLNYSNYEWIFTWTVYFKVLELYIYKKITYDFTIQVYIVFSVSCQKYVLTTFV